MTFDFVTLSFDIASFGKSDFGIFKKDGEYGNVVTTTGNSSSVAVPRGKANIINRSAYADATWSLEGPRTDNVRTQPFGESDDDRFMDPKWGMRPTSAL